MATTSTRRALIAALAVQGFDAAAISKQVRVSLRTVRRYLADPTTRAEIRSAEQDRLRELTRRTGALGTAAVTILAKIAADTREPSGARVAAAARLVDLMIRLSEHVDLAERIATLEVRMDQRGEAPTWLRRVP